MSSGISCENGIFSDVSITSSLRSAVQVLMKRFTIFQSHGLSGWFVLKIVKSCLNLSKLRPKYYRSLFSWKRCSATTNNMKLVPYTGRWRVGCYIWPLQRGGDWAGPQPSRALLAVPVAYPRGGGDGGDAPPEKWKKITSSTIVVNFYAYFVGVPVISALFSNQAPSTIIIMKIAVCRMHLVRYQLLLPR